MKAGTKNGSPMMWSQCRCDMKMWKVCGDAVAPRRRRLAERPQAAAHVADEELGTAGVDLHAGAVAAVGAGGRERQAGEDRFEVGLAGERAAARRAQRAEQLFPHVASGQGDRERAPRPPEPHALHGAAEEPALRYCASAAAEHSAIASSSVAVTVRMRSKRLMAKISATTLLQRRDEERRFALAHLLGGDHEDAQADAADVLDPGEVEHERALGGRGSRRPAASAPPRSPRRFDGRCGPRAWR